MRDPHQPPEVAEPGPYYADVAAWSSILSTTIPMFGGFLLVAVAVRDDSGGGFNQPIVEEEVGMQVGGFMLIGLGTIFGPSIGHLYAGDVKWGLAGMGLRLVGIGGSAAMIAGGASLYSEDKDSRPAGVAVMALGTGLGAAGLGLVIWDLFDAPEAARRANREHRKEQKKKKNMVSAPEVSIGLGSASMRWTF